MATWTLFRPLAVLVVLLLGLVGAVPRPARADEALLLDVVVNGYSIAKIGEFILRGGALFARPSELRALGLRIADATPTADGLVALGSLPGVSARLDQSTQTINITAGGDRLLPAVLHPDAAASGNEPLHSGFGTTLNYDLSSTSSGGRSVATGIFDLRGFSPWGVLSSGALMYAGGGPGGLGTSSAIRLDTTYVYSDLDAMRRYHLGDLIAGGLSWTRPVRLGGIQINSDFSMRPDLVTFPLPSIGGSVAVPSTVDVLINGASLMSRQIQPGPFQIPELPVVTGSGTIAMTVTDALGRQVTTTLPFYASPILLASGLQSYSLEAGLVRRNWGIVSNDYGNPAVSASYRRGLSSMLTVEIHAEGTNGAVSGGGGVAMNVANLAVINAAVAASTASGRPGTQFTAGVQRIGKIFSLGATASVASRGFRDLAAMNGDPVPRRQISANAGLSLGRFGSFGVAYTAIDLDAAPPAITFFAEPGSIVTPGASFQGRVTQAPSGVVSFQPAQHAHILSASYSAQVGRMTVYATGFHDFASRSGNTGILFGVTIPLGSRSSASADVDLASGSRSVQLQAAQSAVSIGDVGYQIYGSSGPVDHEFAELLYKSPWGLISGGADRTGHQTALRAEMQGAFSMADGGLFASNTINDSFAVVDTNGTPGIRVLSENREVGKTDAAGRLLVPDLRSFDRNHISIDPTDVPADVVLPFASLDVRPPDRSGVVVRFPMQAGHAALVRLIDVAGRPLPVGSVATLAADGTAVPVGYDGEAFVTDLRPNHNRLSVERPTGQRCVAVFDYSAVPGEIPKVGPLICRDSQP